MVDMNFETLKKMRASIAGWKNEIDTGITSMEAWNDTVEMIVRDIERDARSPVELRVHQYLSSLKKRAQSFKGMIDGASTMPSFLPREMVARIRALVDTVDREFERARHPLPVIMACHDLLVFLSCHAMGASRVPGEKILANNFDDMNENCRNVLDHVDDARPCINFSRLFTSLYDAFSTDELKDRKVTWLVSRCAVARQPLIKETAIYCYGERVPLPSFDERFNNCTVLFFLDKIKQRVME